ALPVLLFYKVAKAPIGLENTNSFFWGMFAGTVASIGGMYLVALLLRVPGSAKGVLVQASFRGNLAFLGLPIVVYTCRQLPDVNPEAMEATIVLAMTPIVIIYNIASIAALIFHNDAIDRSRVVRHMAMGLFSNPIMISCLLGLTFNLSGLELPMLVDRTCETLSPAAFPLALLAIGSQLSETAVKKQHLAWALAASLMKIVLSPLAALWVGHTLGMSHSELKILLLMAGMPTAVSSYVLADQLKADAPLSAGVVMVCTILCFISLSVILIWPEGGF
ncbi:MAG: AEC family transporter, partial [Verrucomicrobiota bacterium]